MRTPPVPTGPIQVIREDRHHDPSYIETYTMSATPHTTGGLPDGTEAPANIQTLTRSFTSDGGEVTDVDSYFFLGSLAYTTDPTIGMPNTNYYVTHFDYDTRGRLYRTTSPTGTITQTDFDGLNRVKDTQIGTSIMNLVMVSQNTYDQPIPGMAGGIGDGNLTEHTDIPGGGAPARETDNLFDWRDRLVVSKQGVQAQPEDTTTHRPITYSQYDNLNEVVSSESYDGDMISLGSLGSTNGVPNRPDPTKLRAKTTNSYDNQQRLFLTSQFSVDQGIGTVSANSLNTSDWFNHRGDLIKMSQPGGLVTKTQYDGADRAMKAFTTNDVANPTWEDAGTPATNLVITQTENMYDKNDNVKLTIHRDRFHYDITTLGDLSVPVPAIARSYYVASYYDLADRPTDSVNVGTNGGSPYSPPMTVPMDSDTVLVTHTDYNAAGWASLVTDPRLIQTQTSYDMLQRVTKTVENFQGDGTPTNTTNRTTQYTYDGANHILTLTAVLPNSVVETTQFAYGVTTPSSAINSNDLLASVTYPQGTSQRNTESYLYDALDEMTAKMERNFNATMMLPQTHFYTYDVLGRMTADSVTVLGDGVDGSVRRLQTAYDTGGRPYLFTSYDQPSGGNVVNQVERLFNGLGQVATEYQSHSGAVNTMTTPNVQYTYSFVSAMGGPNHSRLVSIQYPSNNRTITYNYNFGFDNSISRVSALSDNTGSLQAYFYMGLNTVVATTSPVNVPSTALEMTYFQSGGNGDAGDQYVGLDRFGRIIDQHWLVTNGSTSTDTDHFTYTYDRDNNPTTRNNTLHSALNEGYTYDGFNQLTNFTQGTHSQNWALDAIGNWTGFMNDNNPTQNSTFNLQNQITSISGAVTPTYDNNGNTTRENQVYSYVYDAWNRLEPVAGPVNYILNYDALGRRLNDTTNLDLYYSAAWQVIEERQGGVEQAHYVWSPAYIDALIERDTSSGRLYAQHDANWNVTALVDTMGNAQERYIYDPYGKATTLDPNTWAVRAGSQFNWIYLFQGGRFDSVTGLYNFRERDLSLTLGRWIQQDPMMYEDGLTLYGYEGDSPVDSVDSLGLFFFSTSTLFLRPSPFVPRPALRPILTTPKPPIPPPMISMPRPEPKPVGPNPAHFKPGYPSTKPWKCPETDSDCSRSQLDYLSSKVNRSCPDHGFVNFPEVSGIRLARLRYSCDEMQELADKWEACANARRTRENKCFRGGNYGHQIALAQAEYQNSYAWYYLRKWGCVGERNEPSYT